MKAAVAIQRKVLELIYVLLKTKTAFQSKYEIKKSNKKWLPLFRNRLLAVLKIKNQKIKN